MPIAFFSKQIFGSIASDKVAFNLPVRRPRSEFLAKTHKFEQSWQPQTIIIDNYGSHHQSWQPFPHAGVSFISKFLDVSLRITANYPLHWLSLLYFSYQEKVNSVNHGSHGLGVSKPVHVQHLNHFFCNSMNDRYSH